MELLLILLEMVKWGAISAGMFGLIVILIMLADLLKEEWDLHAEKWRTSRSIPEEIGVVRHHHRAKHEKLTREKWAWEKYFFEDIGKHRVVKDAAFVHPYIAVRPRLHRYTIQMETRHA